MTLKLYLRRVSPYSSRFIYHIDTPSFFLYSRDRVREIAVAPFITNLKHYTHVHRHFIAENPGSKRWASEWQEQADASQADLVVQRHAHTAIPNLKRFPVKTFNRGGTETYAQVPKDVLPGIFQSPLFEHKTVGTSSLGNFGKTWHGRTDRPTDQRTDGRTHPLIEMRSRI